MKKFLLSAAAVAAASMSAPASAAIQFAFDPGNSFVTVSPGTTVCLIGPCSLTASLATPFDSFFLDVGETETFDFADFVVNGLLGGGTAHVQAQLAFTNPDSDPANTGGTAIYKTFFGVITAGKLTWSDPIQHLVGANNEQFTVKFHNLEGVTLGSGAASQVSITLDAVPEPATWAMMIGGFGLVGAAMRRRVSKVVYA